MTESVTAKVGERIAALRRSSGIKQADLARILGVSVDSLGRAEAGSRRIGLDELAAIAEALEVRAAELLAEQPAPTGVSLAHHQQVIGELTKLALAAGADPAAVIAAVQTTEEKSHG